MSSIAPRAGQHGPVAGADSIAFVARGREFRSEFHSDPSDEVMYMGQGRHESPLSDAPRGDRKSP